jgi:hypothetical protein
MATYSQDIIFTVLPFGMHTDTSTGDRFLNFSLVISPRLDVTGTSPDLHLRSWLDWASPTAGIGRTWPETLAAILPSATLSVPGLQSTAYPVTVLGPAAHRANSTKFGIVFPGTTPVTPYVFADQTNRKIRSAPVGHAVDAISSNYGEFGFKSPTTFPGYADLVDVTAFGPMGFQQTNPVGSTDRVVGIPGSGEARKTTLTNALEAALTANKALPYNLSTIAAATGVEGAATSMAFLEHLKFLHRNLPKKSNTLTTSPPPPTLDFHQMVAALGGLPTLLRVMGIVVDMHAGPIGNESTVVAGVDTTVHFNVHAGLFKTSTNVVHPRTQTHIGAGIFTATPKPATPTDHVAKMLKIGDPGLYRLIRVDHDTAVMKTIQFANNVTRSRLASRKQTPMTPDDYALPALRTGGFAIARSGRAVQMVKALERQTTDLQNGLFGPGPTPTLYEDDLIRGYRFDVLDVADGTWRSLMWRQGMVTVNGTPALNVLEEDTVVPAPTTGKPANPPNPNADLYLQETLTRWDGWSLAVPRIGKLFLSTTPPVPSTGFNVTTDWHVPTTNPNGNVNDLRLPRLRFGRKYRLRARAADLAGNALAVKSAPHSGIVVTPELTHLRFEPIPAPRAVLLSGELWSPPAPMAPDQILRPGDSEEVVVIRSESATVNAKTSLDNGVSIRLLLPAQSSVTMAEQHGAFDENSTAGKPMDPSTFADIAGRDAKTVNDGAKQLHPSLNPQPTDPATTTNPYLFDDFVSIAYLPEFVSPSALVRHLPINAFKETTAKLPFDTAKNGWPELQAVRVRLTRGPNNWTTTVVPNTTDATRTTQLDLTLAKGVEITTLVNSGITQATALKMALWEWIQDYAQKNNKNPSAVFQHILAGEHWMFTPWRRLRFVHAVRTPLLDPVLLIKPIRSTIGQTDATFTGTQADPTGGTILFSRRSTARVDVDGSWKMPIDTGSNTDPVTPQAFRAHAFDIEPKRVGDGFAPDGNGNIITKIDAQNLVPARHEFHDTKFRAVTYKATATSFYTEYFRQHFALPLGASPVGQLQSGPYEPGVAFEASTVELSLTGTINGTIQTRKLTPAPAGTDPDSPPDPPPGDYVVIEDPTLNGANPDSATHGTIQILANANVPNPSNGVIDFSYVGPTIHTFSDPASDKTVHMHVLNSARPKAPDVLYVIPIYKRAVTNTSATRTGNALRVYLNRPWWSSGDEERLGVVCWHRKATDGKLPGDKLRPYVTLWGFDPMFKSSTSLPGQPTPASFPLATKSSSTGALTIEELTTKVDVAGHDVGYDAKRRLWYCDIQVTDARHNPLTTYTPFIKLALARYQPFSIANAHLSRVVQVDYAQLAPNRHLTLSGSIGDQTRTVTIAGRSPRATWKKSTQDNHIHTATNKIIAIIEQRDTRIPDDELAWVPATGGTGFTNTITLTATATSSTTDFVTWTGTIHLPAGNTHQLRLAIEEYERIEGGVGKGRLAWTETIPLTQLPT